MVEGRREGRNTPAEEAAEARAGVDESEVEICLINCNAITLYLWNIRMYTIHWCSTGDARGSLRGIYNYVDKVLAFCKYYVCFTVTSCYVVAVHEPQGDTAIDYFAHI